MESSAPLWFSVIIYALEISVAAKILYVIFFKDRFTQGEITEKQSPELAGKRYLVYTQIVFVTKAYICEDPALVEYFKSQNKKVVLPEDFGQVCSGKVRRVISTILWALSLIESVLKMMALAIWNFIKQYIPMVAKMTGMDRDTVNYQRKRAYEELLYHGWDNMSEYDRNWLK